MIKIIVIFVILTILAATTMQVILSYNSFKSTEKDYIEHNIEYDVEDLIEAEKYNLYRAEPSNIFASILLPIAIIAILFGEEKRKKTFEILKVMPYTRYEIFFNKILVALVGISLPFIINGLIMLLALGVNSKLRLFYSGNQIIMWIFEYLYYQLPILSFTLLLSTLTGTTISQVILTAIFLVFPTGITGLVGFNLEFWGFSDLSQILSRLIERTFMMGILGVVDSLERGVGYIILYIGLSILLIILSKLLFDKSKAERSGETLEFEGTETFFKSGVSICTALLMGVIAVFIFEDCIYYSSIGTGLVLIIGYVLGGGLGWFLSNWSIKLNKSKG